MTARVLVVDDNLANVRLLDPKQDAIRQAFTQQQGEVRGISRGFH